MRLKINLILWILFSYGMQLSAQMDEFRYQRELFGISDDWHSITIEDKMYTKVSSNLSDIRIYGITNSNDTIEAPYILKKNEPKRLSKNVVFKYVNKSTTQNGSFITFKIPLDALINHIQLFFEQDNFDRLVRLEGSQDLKNWFTITDDYRVLSVKNELTEYSFTTLKFPDSKYTYYRVFVKGKNAPDVKRAEITLKEIQEGDYREYKVKTLKTKEEKQNKNTVITVDLGIPVPVSYIKIRPNATFDYYRPFRIAYLRDSVQKENRFRYNYQNITSGVLNSIDENEFNFYSKITNKIRIVIDNQDNESLAIDEIEVKGFNYELITRFTGSATYFLTYGNKNVSKPSYDLKYMTEKIPKNIKSLRLGEEKNITRISEKKVEPLFTNKAWLWGIMLVIIILLGSFTLMMMKKR